MKSVGGLGTVAIVLALAAPASATDYTVDPGKPTDGCTGTTCKTIDQAAGAAADNDTLKILPGVYGSPAAFTKKLRVTGSGSGLVLILGTVTFSADGTLQRVLVSAGANNPAVRVTAPVTGTRAVTIESSMLSGAGSGAGLEAAASALGSIAITGRHLTIADSGNAPATNLTNGVTGTSSASLTSSIVLGTNAGNAPSTPGSDTDGSAGHKSALFVSPGQENFFLRVDSPAIDQGGSPAAGESTDDVEGEPRTGAWDRGADEFVNHPPGNPSLIVSPNPARPGTSVDFGAFTSDPDASRGDLATTYRWNFGDGSPVVNTLAASSVSGVTTHTYAAPGQYTATVTALDRQNQPSGASNPVTVTVSVSAAGGGSGPDVAPPRLSITSPRSGQRLKRGKRAPVLRGRTSDATGVRSVELALRRFAGRRCRWYDGRRAFVLGACATPRFFRAVINDFAWSYTFPRRIVPGTGSYELRARATDFLGHRTTAFTASAKTLARFRIVR
jgi:hypothetical protein